MIKPSVLHNISNRKLVRPQQIEKDYIISWLLWGISKHDWLKEVLIFKGGTCLLKIYIPDFRYSEDMDFTLNPVLADDVLNSDIYLAFDEVFWAIKNTANIDISIAEDSKEIHKATNSIKFFIEYVGPLGGRGAHVKVDITKGEKLEYGVEYRDFQHDYPDLYEEEIYPIQC